MSDIFCFSKKKPVYIKFWKWADSGSLENRFDGIVELDREDSGESLICRLYRLNAIYGDHHRKIIYMSI